MLTLNHNIFIINTPNHNWEEKLLYMTGGKVVKIYVANTLGSAKVELS